MNIFVKHNTAPRGLILNSGNPGDEQPSLQHPFVGSYNESNNTITPIISMDTTTFLKTTIFG
jgi:hypothetical protein